MQIVGMNRYGNGVIYLTPVRRFPRSECFGRVFLTFGTEHRVSALNVLIPAAWTLSQKALLCFHGSLSLVQWVIVMSQLIEWILQRVY